MMILPFKKIYLQVRLPKTNYIKADHNSLHCDFFEESGVFLM